MNLQERIHAFIELGKYLNKDIYQDAAEELCKAEVLNSWFN